MDEDSQREWATYPQTKTYLRKLEERISAEETGYASAENWAEFQGRVGIVTGLRLAMITIEEMKEEV